MARFLARNPDTCFVAEDEKVVGVILAGNEGRRGYLYHTAVDPLRRGEGLGTRLVEAALDRDHENSPRRVCPEQKRKSILGKAGVYRERGPGLPEPVSDGIGAARHLNRRHIPAQTPSVEGSAALPAKAACHYEPKMKVPEW